MQSRFSWTFPPDRSDFDKDIYVIGCGYDIISSGDVTRHFNNDNRINFHILYFTHGKCTVSLKGKEHILTAGDMVFFYTGDPYVYTYHHDPETRVYWLHFGGEKSPQLMNDMGFTDSFIIRSETNLSRHFDNIIEEVIVKKKQYNKAMNAHLYLLLTAIVRKKVASDPGLDAVIAMMSDMKNAKLSLDDYAKLCNLSKSQFIRNFKKYTGETPVKFKNDLIIKNAIRYLTNTNDTITEISSSLGFENIYYFSTMFKKFTGFSPAEYRKR